jgi:hypothetical protein
MLISFEQLEKDVVRRLGITWTHSPDRSMASEYRGAFRDSLQRADKAEAARTINEALVAKWTGFEIAERLSAAPEGRQPPSAGASSADQGRH